MRGAVLFTRSLRRRADGIPVARHNKPIVLNVQARPNFAKRASFESEIIVPPRPPPANTSPLASPRLRLKYCAGRVEMDMKQRAHPRPITIPTVKKRSGIEVDHELIVSPIPRREIPTSATLRVPY